MTGKDVPPESSGDPSRVLALKEATANSKCTVYIYMIYVHISVYHVIYHKKRAANEKAAVTMEGPLHCPTQYENMNTRS